MALSNEQTIRYRAEATARRFHNSGKMARGIMGPIGSGKSVACMMELWRRIQSAKVLSDGKRRSRWAVIRNTYPELKSTTIKTFQEWIPEEIGHIKWDPPITCDIKFNDIEAEVIFLALDQPKDVRKLLSLELTGAFINEARELNFDVIKAVMSRIGRYPAKRDGGFDWSGLIMDTNPPDDDSWWYRLAETEKPDGWEFFRQPPAIIKNPQGQWVGNPDAENVRNHTLGYEYWLRQTSANKEDWIKVMLQGEYGSVMDGKPVYTDYLDSVHCAAESLDVIKGLPLYLGFDYGRTPACIFMQHTPEGQVRVIDELLVDADAEGNGMSIRTFMRELVMPHLRNNYRDMIYVAYGDPAGTQGGQGDELSCMDIQAEEGLFVEPAPGSNDPTLRRDAINKHLKSMIGGKPAFVVSPKCSMYRKGMNGGFRYKRMQVAGDAKYQEKPEKNRFSHPCEAGEYAALGLNEKLGYQPTKARAVVNSKRAASGWT
jgi:hypothetical protein